MSWMDTNFAEQSNEAFAEGTLGNHLVMRMTRLMRALGQDAGLARALAVARVLAKGWFDRESLPWPAWPSDITDDHSPFEFSLAFNESSEIVRILTEPQAPLEPSLVASWRAAAEVHEDLATHWRAGFANYDKVADLFAPRVGSSARFCVWHAGILGGARPPHFKIYLNPAIHGSDDANAVLMAALARLGVDELWATYASRALTRGALDAPIYFSLDLLDSGDARIKIYIAHRAATSFDVARILETNAGFDERSVRRWCREFMGGSGPFEARPPITCFALRQGALDLHSTTLHLPVRCYLEDDLEIARRASQFLNLPQRVRYMRALTALSDRPLESGAGVQTYISLRPSPGKEALTAYLAPQVYASAPSRPSEGWTFFARQCPGLPS
jgi:DMATS type aromatic prenyltransferase